MLLLILPQLRMSSGPIAMLEFSLSSCLSIFLWMLASVVGLSPRDVRFTISCLLISLLNVFFSFFLFKMISKGCKKHGRILCIL